MVFLLRCRDFPPFLCFLPPIPSEEFGWGWKFPLFHVLTLQDSSDQQPTHLHPLSLSDPISQPGRDAEERPG